jgi:hypothetical protein
MTFTVFPLIYTVKRRQCLLAGAASESGHDVSEPDAMILRVRLSAAAREAPCGRREENLAFERASVLRPIASHVPPRFSSEIAS